MRILTGEKVLIGISTFAAHDSKALDCLLSAGCEVVKNPYGRKLTRAEISDLLTKDVTGLIAGLEPLDRDVLKNTNLKIISRCGSGVSNIDLDAAKEFNIKICYTPHGPTTAVAELTLGAMLSLIRQIPQRNSEMHDGKWLKETGIQLEGKTVAIIGFGRIGKKLAALLRPFNVKIIIVDPQARGDEEGVSILSFDKAIAEADIITIHSSGEDQIIGKKEFNNMKPGVFLLNAARGTLVDEDALIQAAKNGRLRGAWLDTFSVEPYTGPLNKYSQVIMTPHIGSYTVECRNSMELEAVENLINAFKRLRKR